MKDNRDELILIDGEYYSHQELVAFIESNRELAQRCERQTRFIKALKLNNSKLTIERNQLLDENMKRIEESNRLFGELQNIKNLSMFEFANKYCNDNELEEAGHALARSLGVGQ